MDRKKDMIISGGFNIYPSDLEAVLPRTRRCRRRRWSACPPTRWGETPVAFVVPKRGRGALTPRSSRAFANARLGKTQRLADVRMSTACRAARSARC